MSGVWQCEECGAYFSEPKQDKNTVFRCPECDSIKINITS